MPIRRLLFLYLLLTSSIASAQLENGTIIGTVRESEGRPLPGVIITATSDSIVSRTLSESTSSDGRYRFRALLPGAYQLQAESTSFTTVQKEARVFVGSTVTLDFQMEVGGVAEVIEVSETTTLIDETSSAVQHTVPSEVVEDLPRFRSVLDLIKLTPGVGDLDLS
ncbi:MAG TPA: carboxypeptidase-like regulatory domain-containing protein [Acidobacteriota bacterium]|nr:carboxypeptidase-like regulatory domain-containing protein [Acidobacteriota bacterium]